jgi:aspartate racemase
VDVVLGYLQQHKPGRLALLGARPVAEFGKWSPYRLLHESVEVERVKDVEALHELIEDIKKYGPELPRVQSVFKSIVNSLTSRTILLACTELPLVSMDFPEKDLVDVTGLTAKEMVRRSLAYME